jgi:hypothetical protein
MNKPMKGLTATGNAQVVQRGHGDGVKLTTVIPMRIVHHRFNKVNIRPGHTTDPDGERNWQAAMDANLIKALSRAMYWQHLLDSGRVANIAELARAEGLEKMRVQKTLKMARLAPSIVERIARGRGPVGLSFEFFVRKLLPHDWQEQEVLFAAMGQ